MDRHEAGEVAKILIRHYKSSFGGKDKGRYKFTQRALLGISGRHHLRDVFLAELEDELFDLGYVLINLRGTAGPDFALLSHGAIQNYRPLPKRLWEDPDGGDDISDEDGDGVDD